MKDDNTQFPNVTHYTQVDVQPGGINIQHVEHLHQADVLKALGIELEIRKDGKSIDHSNFTELSDTEENNLPNNSDVSDEKKFGQLEELEKQVSRKSEPTLGAASVRLYLDNLLKFIKNARCWFGVAKAMMEKGYVAEGDFDGFCTLISIEYNDDELKYLPNARDLKSMNVLSLNKKIAEWDKDNQPLGEVFNSHKTIALTALRILPNL